MEIQTYIINLPARADRRTHILTEVGKIPFLTPTIIDGIVDGTGTCFQSQRNCIQKAKNMGLEYVLVLEDDAIFTDNCQEVLTKALSEVEKIDWDMLFLGANLHSLAYTVSDRLCKLTGAYCAHAYIVHSRFYDTILSLPHDREMDVYYAQLMRDNNIYICKPMIAYQLPSHSDLQNGFRDYNEEMSANFLRYVQ